MQPHERYVVGIDSSTQSVKAIAWTTDGTPRAEGRPCRDERWRAPGNGCAAVVAATWAAVAVGADREAGGACRVGTARGARACGARSVTAPITAR